MITSTLRKLLKLFLLIEKYLKTLSHQLKNVQEQNKFVFTFYIHVQNFSKLEAINKIVIINNFELKIKIIPNFKCF